MCLLNTLEKHLHNYRLPGGWIAGFGNTQSLYVHLPKTAGTSIALCCYGEDPWHFPLSHYNYLSTRYFKQLFKFTFVRNPYFRLLSAYKYSFKQAQEHPKTSVRFVTKFESFELFVKEWLNQKNVYSHYFFLPQYKYICDQNKNIKVDYVGKFEDIGNDFSYVQKTLNITEALPEVNKSPKRNVVEYSDEIAELVYQVYKDDFDLFGYEKSSYKK